MNIQFTKIRSFVILLTITFLLLSFPADAAAKAYKVTTPTFPVSLNGFLASDEDYFPLLVYKNITYVPLTQDMADLLNLRVFWEQSTRTLTIQKNPTKSTLFSGFGAPSHQKPKSFQAQIAGYNIYVNGKKIDQAKETYPILNFRNITYFPLTWRFAVTEFGWKYHFDMAKGLQIISKNYDPALLPNEKSYGDNHTPLNSDLPALTSLKENKALKMPLSAFKEPFFYKNGNVFYFVNRTESIEFWRQALNGKAEKIGSAAISGKDTLGYHYAELYPSQDLLFASHFGGATLGSSKHYLLPDRENATLFSQNRYSFIKSHKDGFVASLFSVSGPMVGLQFIDRNGNHKSFGTEDNIYSKGVIEGNMLYALVQNVLSSSTVQAGAPLYQINLNDGKHTKLLDRIYDFALNGNKIYYRMSEPDKDIYCYDMATQKTKKVQSLFETNHNFSVMGNTLFTGIVLNSDDSNTKTNLYRNQGGKWQLIAKEVQKPQFSNSHLVYVQKEGKNNILVITDSKGNAQAKIMAGQKEIDYFLNSKELIYWSWQDQTVRYFKLD